MPDRTNATATTAGVLRPEELARHVELAREPVSGRVGAWVENHWALRWVLPEGRVVRSEVLPHPTASLTVELGTHPRPELPPGESVVVTGVCTPRFDVEVRGRGLVLGVRFRPGGLAALTGRTASGWVDRSVPARGLLPDRLVEQLADPGLVAEPAAWRAAAETGLTALDPGEDPRYDLLLRVVRDMLEDHTLVTVAEVARRHGRSVRTLQRLFLHYVGVGPKWVLVRYRMHDVVTAVDEGFAGSLTELAHRFGWYDQAHLTRDFVALLGTTPGRYRDRRP
ncbi:helix-turn-helix transcriptional regulator [Phycicoccus endophyticus]|uniref:Helix-turn-helix transcriptional regulator n=1 Tax=Phycicoccus endophyticus TaxID=1690220 RepID=A0A7G9R043_9MICO|nr:AraC family transcriptional regulator [Phycicoccus endophyticus]QNN48968.1 helix-turn-helix transcriptional regulator [Phycicoccus endophyticus]